MHRRLRRSLFCSSLVLAMTGARLWAEVVSVEIAGRQPYAEGREFGERGVYEQLRGTVRFAVDPALEANQQVVDIELAPRNAEGKVEFSADLEILLPADFVASQRRSVLRREQPGQSHLPEHVQRRRRRLPHAARLYRRLERLDRRNAAGQRPPAHDRAGRHGKRPTGPRRRAGRDDSRPAGATPEHRSLGQPGELSAYRRRTAGGPLSPGACARKTPASPSPASNGN